MYKHKGHHGTIPPPCLCSSWHHTPRACAHHGTIPPCACAHHGTIPPRACAHHGTIPPLCLCSSWHHTPRACAHHGTIPPPRACAHHVTDDMRIYVSDNQCRVIMATCALQNPWSSHRGSLYLGQTADLSDVKHATEHICLIV